jgi:hypothetical protein
MLRYRLETLTDLRALICDLPDDMKVAATGEAGLTARTVGELRQLDAWPRDLVIQPPRFAERPESILRVERAG